MSDHSTLLSLPYILPSQAQKHVTHNEALEILDVLVQLAVQDQGLTTPPANVATGDRYIVGTGAGGAWSGRDDSVAVYDGESQGWRFFTPRAGWRAHVIASGAEMVWTGTLWAAAGGSAAVTELPLLGISTTADATNRLAVSAEATLLTHAGDGAADGGHRLKVNKATAADTASLLFQSDWSGRAEMGLTGSDDFAIRVSADGTTFVTALSFEAATGLASGAAVQTAAGDATAGRLMRVGAFGLGGTAPVAGNIASDLAPGFHGYDAANGSTGGPAGVTAGILLHQRRAAGAEAQILIDADGIVYSRARAGADWGDWRSGGATGGTTAQGRYRREADGTLTCWQSVTTATSGDVAATFPAAFASDSELVTTTGVVGGNGAVSVRVTARSATGLSVAAFDASGARIAGTVDLVTTGPAA